MGAPKQKWTPEEEAALRAGIEKHGAGKWRTIQKDPEFSPYLSTRSNIDLKDKWRNMSVSAGGQGSREKLRIPKLKALPSISLQNSEIPASSAQLKQDGSEAVKDSSRNLQDGNSTPRYASMIIEALSTIREPSGVEIGAICSFIEQKYEVASNFRRLLSTKLRRLVGQNKIEKVQKGFKLKEPLLAMKNPTPKQKDPPHRSRPSQHSGRSESPDMDELAANAAYKIAEADAKSFLASEAFKEAERVSRIAEETDSMLLLASEILQRCTRRCKFML